MSNLKDIVYCSEEQLQTMASGTPVGDHVYDENDLYITPLGDDIIVGAEGSGTKINENNELIVDSTYIQNTVKPDITEAKTVAERAEVIAKGRATAYIYNTIEELETALANEEFVANLVVGDNFYIRALDVPDYWWDGTTKQQLETEKPDLSGLVKDVQADGKTIVQDGVAKIPLMPSNASMSGEIVSGIIRLNGASYCGLSVPYAGAYMRLAVPSKDNINKRSSDSFPLAITLSTLDYAVKVAMCDGKGAAWTEEEKVVARDRMGINDAITAALNAIGVAEEGTY